VVLFDTFNEIKLSHYLVSWLSNSTISDIELIGIANVGLVHLEDIIFIVVSLHISLVKIRRHLLTFGINIYSETVGI